MPNIIKPKRSNTASAVPTTGQLASGELAVNMADKKVYINNGTAVVQVGAGNLSGLGDTNITSPTNGQSLAYNSSTGKWVNSSAGTGDVVGPASATDNAIARFDTTTGKLIQNSSVTLDDNGNAINVNSIGFDTTPATVPATVGTMSWDDGDGVPTTLLKGGNVNLQVGTQEYARVYNDSGTTLTLGQAVYISGAQGNRVAIKLARANVEATSFGTIGLVAETIANGAEGFIITSGALYKLNTTGLTAGATVYLSPTTAGAITTTKPQAPDQLVVIGWVERVSSTVGSIYVKIDNGYELDELHDVRIVSPASGNTLIYDASAGVWKNANLTAGTGISITNGAGSITVTNSAPDQTVSLTGAGATTISGTYPNFTISSVNTTYGAATSTVLGLIELASDTVQSTAANAVTTTAFRTYGLQVNSAGQGVVNVPWIDTTYSAATSTVLGLIELGSDTVQTTAANAVTNTASRTYALQVNSAGQGVVNVPWTGGSFYNAELLVIAGGGSGGATNGGGGGAGGLLYVPTILLTSSSSYTVTVGAGGSGSTSGGNNGNDSVFDIATAIKGGAGSSAISGQSKNGGSGGGGRGETGDAGGTATTGQGNNGGNGVVSPRVSAGGGGKGGAGADGNSGGTGGSGTNDFTTWAIATSSGASNWFCGGGGGGTESVDRTAAGGTGGGGASGNQSNGVAGTANTGGGGGGGSRGSSSSGTYSGGSGGSGIVIVRYVGAQRGSGGTVYTVGGYTYHKFTTSGTYTG